MTPRLHHLPELQALARDHQPRVALILGSGLSDLGNRLRNVVELPFAQVPELETTTVAGHRGVILLGTWAEVQVLVFAGRLHYYEGHPWRRVVQPIHIAHNLGASILVATNAAGGIRADLVPGDLMALRGHHEWTHPDAWRQLHLHGFDPISTSPYSSRLAQSLQQAAQAVGFALKTGIYAQLTGPCYETPAEIRALRVCGADAVGMSTAREIRTGHDLGMECAALSCITNKAAGLSTGPIHHGEVLTTAEHAKDRLTRLLEQFLKLVAVD